jgi:hypothetical protein
VALVLHKVLQDGSAVHEDFSKESWERAMHDDTLLRFWGHPPGDEGDPVGVHWAKLRREGYPCGPKQHEFADREDPAWAGSRGIELVEPPKVAPPPPRPILTDPVTWPPEVPLTPQLLSQMSGLCIDDCKDVLAPPRKELPPRELEPLADKRGQLLLF